LRVDVSFGASRATSAHEERCPELGPECLKGAVPPKLHSTAIWVTEIQALAEYGLANGLALQAVLPLRIVASHASVTDSAGTHVHGDDIHHRDEALVGPSDPELLVHGALQLGDLRLGGRLGASLPLGKVQENPFRLGGEGLAHQHIHFGTGTVDPLLGGDVSFDVGPSTLAAFAFGRTPLYQGTRGYRAGARVAGGLLATSAFGTDGWSFRLGLTGLGETAERWDGVVPQDEGNRGRVGLYLGPGVTASFGDWSVSLDVRARLLSRASGEQIDLPILAQLSLGRLVHLESDEELFHPAGGKVGESGDVLDVVLAGEAAPLVPATGKWTVFDFWAPWCDACKVLDRELRALASGHGQSPAEDHRAAHGAESPSAARPEQRGEVALRRVNIVSFESPIARRELPGVTVLPHVRLADPSGKVVWEGSGPPDEILKAIADMRAAR
jgi:thiol-disulfide isomerase/thioredoxin